MVVINLVVDPEHIDDYGHLNNSWYPKYFEQGRLALEKAFGIDPASYMVKGLKFVVTNATYHYRGQLSAGKNIAIVSKFKPYCGKTLVHSEHEMFCEGRRVGVAVLAHNFLQNDRIIAPLEELLDQLPKE
tara:strand:+ start:380 stop:769 length:390 start_codon:yes stop_codon:yes gene_type:complete